MKRSLLVAVLVVASCFLKASWSGAGTYTIQPGPEGKDTFWGTVYIQDGRPDQATLNYGGWGDYYYDYFEYDLTGAPSPSVTTAAQFCYWVTGFAPHDPQFEVDRITEPWIEADVNSTNNPASVLYLPLAPTVQPGWNCIDILTPVAGQSLYTNWLNGTWPNYGIKLTPNYNNQSNGDMASSDNTDPSIRPKLEITFDDSQSTPGISITLVPEPPDNRYVIDAEPTMPLIQARARVIGVSPDPTPTTVFTWHATLSITQGQEGCGPDASYDDEIAQGTKTTGDGLYTLTFKQHPTWFRGGRLHLSATARVGGQNIEGGTPSDLRIEGTNPTLERLQSNIDGVVADSPYSSLGLQQSEVQDVLKRIACQESQQTQFAASAGGGIGPPLFSSSCDNGIRGIGIFQITTEGLLQKFPNNAFKWPQNIVAGNAKYLAATDKVANKYPSKLAKAPKYKQYFKSTINPARETKGLKPFPPPFPAPDFTTEGIIGGPDPPNQLLEDGTRGYNGFAGEDPFGFVLHEFTPDENYLLNLPDSQLPGVDKDPHVWRRVRPDERPQDSGDPYYFDNVKGKSPQCGE